jgi:riboflavin synthase
VFTGIVEEIGIISSANKTRTGKSLAVKTGIVYKDTGIGDSICINGVCLSAVEINNNVIVFDVIEETLKRTNLCSLKINDPVNLERSLKPDSRLGGHFVSGHIDYTGRLEEILKGTEGSGFRISLPSDFSKFVVEKGSITIDGVSLTAAEVSRNSFTVYLIPHTLKITTLGKKKKGDPVNIETDLLAKYVVKENRKNSLQDLLERYDYI